jgi:integrase
LGFAEKRGGYWRARYKLAPGQYGTVSDECGMRVKFRSRREADAAAADAEAKIRRTGGRSAIDRRLTFGEFASQWYGEQDLAASTMQNYRRHIEEHLLPTFHPLRLAEIADTHVAAWERNERALGYAESSIKTWRGTLHLILADAVEQGLIGSNPATRRRGRGKRAGRSRVRGPEKPITSPLGLLLLAERAALLAGRDDEFVAMMLMGYTGIRWAELVGLEVGYVRAAAVRVEWQLYELDNGVLHRCPPKDDSHRTIDLPPQLSRLLADHVKRAAGLCSCHERQYVFSGHGTVAAALRRPGAKLVDVARRADVSAGTVSNVLNRPDLVPETTRQRVLAAVAELGYVRGRATPAHERAPHWRRNGFATWLFQPAATGWYPRKAPQPAHPVPIVAEPWPGIPVRGRNAASRAEACWLPVARGLTPHGLRHTHKTLMVELGTPPKLMDERMGHEDGSVQARYSHVTAEMRQRLVADLSAMWEAALDERRQHCPRSPVAALDALLSIGPGDAGREPP